YQPSRSLAEETSAMTASASPCASISDRVFSNSEAEREHIETLQPSSANASAQAFPRPLLAAATIATRSLMPRSIVILQGKPRSNEFIRYCVAHFHRFSGAVARCESLLANKKRWPNVHCAIGHL